MQRKKINSPKKITPEMLEKGKVLLSRDVLNGISSYSDADANNDFIQLNDLCEKFENEHNVTLNNLDVSIVNLIAAIQNRTQRIEQYNTTLQSIHDSFKDYLATRITSVPKYVDNEQRLELASHNKNLHATASNWLVRNTESAKNIWGNINEFNELIDKGLAGNNLVIKRRQELQELLVKLNSNVDASNPNQDDSKDQDAPPPYSEQNEPLASSYAPVRYGVTGGLMLPQEYEPLEGVPLPSAPPLDINGINIIQVASKEQMSSEIILSQLNKPQAPVSKLSLQAHEDGGDDRAKKLFNSLKMNLAKLLSTIYSHISTCDDKTESKIMRQEAAFFARMLQELESFALPNAYDSTNILTIIKKTKEFCNDAQDNAARNTILNELSGIVAVLKADVLRLKQKTESILSTTVASPTVTSIANQQPNINQVNNSLPLSDASLQPSAPSPALKKSMNMMEKNEQRQFGNIVIPPLNILRKVERLLLNFLTSRNKREIVNFSYTPKALISMEASILLCEKNNIVYCITDNPGTVLDTKYSSHQDPLIKSIFAYLDLHFKPIVSQLSQDAQAMVVLASNEKEEVKISVRENGMFKNINVPQPMLSSDATIFPSLHKTNPQKEVKEISQSEQTQFGNIVIPSLSYFYNAERLLIHHLNNKSKRIMVGILYDHMLLKGIEAVILLCEKNNIAYHINNNPGTELDTKYSSHKDPSIKSIFAYLDLHFKPIISQLSQDVLANVVLASDENEEVEESVESFDVLGFSHHRRWGRKGNCCSTM